jgi:hypothetical protein
MALLAGGKLQGEVTESRSAEHLMIGYQPATAPSAFAHKSRNRGPPSRLMRSGHPFIGPADTWSVKGAGPVDALVPCREREEA